MANAASKAPLLTVSQVRHLSVIADQCGDERVWALCAKVGLGNAKALRELSDSFHAARTTQRARRAAR